MKKILFGVTLALFSGAAVADSYQDFNAGIAARNRGEYAAAVTYLSSALAAPDLSDALRVAAYEARGTIYQDAGRPDAAIADFMAALKLRPDEIMALRARAKAEQQQGRYTEAIATFKQMVALQPNNFLLNGDLFDSYYKVGNVASAIAGYSDFILKRPTNPVPLDGRARMELALGQIDSVIADENSSIALYAKWAPPHSVLSTAYAIRGDFKNSAKEADAAIDSDKQGAAYYLQRAYAEWFLGDASAAVSSLNECLEKQPHQNYAFIWLSLVLAHQGKQVPADIAAQFSDVTEANWPGPLELLYLERESPDAVLKLTGSNPDAMGSKRCLTHFFVGEWYIGQGKPKDAKPLLQEAASDLCDKSPMYARFAATDLARLPGASP